MTLRRTAMGIVAGLVLLVAGPMLTLAFGPVSLRGDWRTATHRPAGLAPDPASHDEAIVQIYASRTFGWRGAFAVHTWLAAKPAGSDRYVRYEVIGWNLRTGSTAVSVSDGRAPDAEWFGATPYLIRDLRGHAAEVVIDKLPQAVASYPYAGTYRAWPGPNSNTFIAHLGRAIPELRVRLPSLAIGKDYLADGQFLARTPSGTGYQVSFHGILGAAAGSEEGLELNVFGLVTGVDWLRPALVLPGIGRIPPG
jgi:hypothetical protein